jgi:c-di-GMP-binding flagellar brake protein YcgR
MWQAPNQRLKAQANQKRSTERGKLSFHIKRVSVTLLLQVPGGEPVRIDARVLLNDFSLTGMGIFTAHHFNPDDLVTVVFESPKKLEMKARIAWCQDYQISGTKVLRAQSLSYRAGVEFLFTAEEEEKAVKEFCDELVNQHQCICLATG